MAKKVVPFPFPEQPREITSAFLGGCVKAKRTHAGLTMHQAAMLCGVSVDVFTKLENAKGGVTLESFLKVANGLGLDMQFGDHL